MAGDYGSSRPPYPEVLFEVLRDSRVIGPGLEVLEIGAGSGLATHQLLSSGSHVVALEPGRELATVLARENPGASVLQSRLEDASLPEASFDSAVAATSMHWLELPVALPRLHAALRPGGALASFRNVFGDDSVRTEFRDRVRRIVARRASRGRATGSEVRPTMAELAAGGWFVPVDTQRWKWSVELTSEQLTRLFSTFSDWDEQEIDEVRLAAEACGGRVTEHYQTVLHILRRA